MITIILTIRDLLYISNIHYSLFEKSHLLHTKYALVPYQGYTIPYHKLSANRKERNIFSSVIFNGQKMLGSSFFCYLRSRQR